MTTDLTVRTSSNRLAVIPKDRPGKVTEQSLRDYAARLNTEHWVQASGKLYFVNTRPGDGGVIHFLDREGAS
jgi:hypothetical protein